MGKISKFKRILSPVIVTLVLNLCLAVSAGTKGGKCTKGHHFENKKKDANYAWDPKPADKGPTKCTWTVVGGPDCVVSMSCNLDMQGGDDTYVKVSDGVGGEETYTGKTSFKVRPSSEDLRDLFLAVYAPEKYSGGGVKCTASCTSPGAKVGDPLPKNVEKKRDMRCVCGLQNKDDRIVGGEDSKMNEFPWQAAVVFAKTRSPNCGASVINDRFVLTAAHCFWFDKKKPEQIEVLIHAHTLDMTKKKSAKDVELGKDGSIRSSGYNLSKKTDEDEKTQRFKVLEIINHPLFSEYYDFDVALLRLDKKINLADPDAPTPVCLPPGNAHDTYLNQFKNKKMTVVGWGLAAENAGGTTRVLQKLDVPYLEYNVCEETNPDLVTPRMLCAGYMDGTKKDACTGDSGGPLIFQMPNKQFVQTGIVSWGEGCARKGKPGVYSHVNILQAWVLFHSKEQNAKWCQDEK